MINKNYILITPVKNEENFLPSVIQSVIEQTIKPKLWVIVDDGSVDGTPLIIDKYSSEHPWIKKVTLPESERNLRFQYPFVCVKGFDYAIELCKQIPIEYDFIALLDADTILEREYYDKIFSQFQIIEDLGIASGGIYHKDGDKIKWRGTMESLPSGSGRVWRKECFFDTGGYLIETSPDSISNVMAKLRGWQTRQFKDIIAIEQRTTSSAEGIWKGATVNGWKAYYLDKNFILVIMTSINLLLKKPYYHGFGYLYGYVKSLIIGEKKIENNEIRNYNSSQILKERLNEILLRE